MAALRQNAPLQYNAFTFSSWFLLRYCEAARWQVYVGACMAACVFCSIAGLSLTH